jgi:nicotinamide phosphoribosyltransferase
MRFIPSLLCDFYKVSHLHQYPEGTTEIYSTWIPRTSRNENIDEVVAFGFQGFIKEFLIDYFNNEFFGRGVELICSEYERYIKFTLGVSNPNSDHIRDLHNLGYLPIEIVAVPEGTKVPLRVPMLTIVNTHPNFFWVTNYLETIMSAELWLPSTSATIANKYREILEYWAMKTVGNVGHVQFQGHDFSMRGMTSLHSAATSGAGHLLSFVGTDTIPAIMYHEEFYNADIEKELVGTSIPATEHSVQCTFGDDELYFKTMISEVYPNGFVSIVSDGYDYWKMISEVIPSLKSDIMARNGKVVIRPDSGDPVKIICGDTASTEINVKKGTVESLWEIFGGTINELGYKELDPHVGVIYGDAITIDRANEICRQLEAKGFASSNIVFGVGSYTYQYNTRDTFGFALKSTNATVNGEEIKIFKDPKTDDGVKKSLKGMVGVIRKENGTLQFVDNMNKEELSKLTGNIMRPIFRDGKLLVDDSLQEIRNRIRE